MLPEKEEDLVRLLKNGEVIAFGRVWYLDENGLHYRTLKDTNGQQLEFEMEYSFAKDSLFGGGGANN